MSFSEEQSSGQGPEGEVRLKVAKKLPKSMPGAPQILTSTVDNQTLLPRHTDDEETTSSTATRDNIADDFRRRSQIVTLIALKQPDKAKIYLKCAQRRESYWTASLYFQHGQSMLRCTNSVCDTKNMRSTPLKHRAMCIVQCNEMFAVQKANCRKEHC